MRIAAPASELARVLTLTEACAGALVGRAALGVSYIEVEPAAIDLLRAGLPRGAHSVALDIPWYARDAIDPWPRRADRDRGADARVSSTSSIPPASAIRVYSSAASDEHLDHAFDAGDAGRPARGA